MEEDTAYIVDRQGRLYQIELAAGRKRLLALVPRPTVRLHPGQVLNGTADTAGNVELWRNRFTGLSNLTVMRYPTGVDSGTGSAGSATQRFRQAFNQVVVLWASDTTATGNDNIGFRQVDGLGGMLNNLNNLGGLFRLAPNQGC